MAEINERIIVRTLARGCRVDVLHQPPSGGPPVRLSSDHYPKLTTGIRFAELLHKASGLQFEIRTAPEGGR